MLGNPADAEDILNDTPIKESALRIAGPWVLGLFSLSAATFVVAARMATDASPWYGKAWHSVQIADRPTAGLARGR